MNLIEWLTLNVCPRNEVTKRICKLFGLQTCVYQFPDAPFPRIKYGMGIHDTSMDVSEYLTLLKSGIYIRTDMPYWDISANRWDRIDIFIDRIEQVAAETGEHLLPIVVLRGWTNAPVDNGKPISGTTIQMTPDMTAEVIEYAAHELSYNFANRYKNKLFAIELWNEPDHEDSISGFHTTDSTNRWFNFTSYLRGAATGIKKANGYPAFSPFMTLNKTKFDLIVSIWSQVWQWFDYFSFHMYDDDPDVCCYWASKMSTNLDPNTPVLVTEHGSASNRSIEFYRKQAWALYQAFGPTRVKAILNYCYDTDQPWIMKDSPLLAKITGD